jgi:hypothetical protein
MPGIVGHVHISGITAYQKPRALIIDRAVDIDGVVIVVIGNAVSFKQLITFDYLYVAREYGLFVFT